MDMEVWEEAVLGESRDGGEGKEDGEDGESGEGKEDGEDGESGEGGEVIVTEEGGEAELAESEELDIPAKNPFGSES